MPTLSYYQLDSVNGSLNDISAPLAIVRYTMIGEDNVAINVEEAKYQDSIDDIAGLEGDVVVAIECDVEVSIITYRDIKYFQQLDTYLESIDYYLKEGI